jgi:hypothetical protein
MAWTIRHVFKKPGGDPLYEFFTTYPHLQKGWVQDPRLLSIGIWRNLDRSIGLLFITWESEESFKSWREDHNVAVVEYMNELLGEWSSSRGITFIREFPEIEDQNWADPKYIVEGTLGYHRVIMEQILAGE